MMIFDEIRSLHSNGLWSNLMSLSGLMLKGNVVSSHYDFSVSEIFWLSLMFGDAAFEVKEYKKAGGLYKEALNLKKHAKPSSDSTEPNAEDIKYKMHLCYVNTSEPTSAFNILQSIPAKLRTPKINMALGRIYQQNGMERAAISCYKEVLKVCPMAMEASSTLLSLGVKPKEIQGLTLDVTYNNPPGFQWFNSWIQALSAIAARHYTNAISTLKNMEEKYPSLRDNIWISTLIGQCHYYCGHSANATMALQRVHKLDPYNLRGMDILAALYAKDKLIKELESLAKSLMNISEEAPESWTAMGYYSYMIKKGTRAIYFAHKACLLQHRSIEDRSIEALLLKGNVLLDLKKICDAINHFREAIQIAPYRYECHKGLVSCYVAQCRHREAVSIATAACKQLNNSPRALTLYANVLVNDPLQLLIPRAKSLLEKALNADPTHLPAVYLLAELLESEMNFEGAISLLKKQLTYQTTCKLHQMLADVLAKTRDEEKAMEHYGIALNLDPKNVHAQEGLQKIEQATDTPMDATYGNYDMEIEDINSDEADLEESETEAVFSDGDINFTPTGSASYLGSTANQ